MPHPGRCISGQHVHNEDVIVSVAVYVSYIQSHGRTATMPHGIGSHSSEGTPTGVDPETVRRTIVIGDDQIRKPVAVEIPKLNAQSPVSGRVYWFSLIIQKRPRDVGQQREVATAIVAIQAIGLGQLHNLALRPHPETTQPARMGRRLPIYLRNARNPPFAGDAHLHGGVR